LAVHFDDKASELIGVTLLDDADEFSGRRFRAVEIFELKAASLIAKLHFHVEVVVAGACRIVFLEKLLELRFVAAVECVEPLEEPVSSGCVRNSWRSPVVGLIGCLSGGLLVAGESDRAVCQWFAAIVVAAARCARAGSRGEVAGAGTIGRNHRAVNRVGMECSQRDAGEKCECDYAALDYARRRKRAIVEFDAFPCELARARCRKRPQTQFSDKQFLNHRAHDPLAGERSQGVGEKLDARVVIGDLVEDPKHLGRKALAKSRRMQLHETPVERPRQFCHQALLGFIARRCVFASRKTCSRRVTSAVRTARPTLVRR
jgi:hypothetical protein